MVTDDGHVLVDSMRIVAHLERLAPDPPLWPSQPARRAEADVFVEWFNLVWKVPPNAMEAELRAPTPDERVLRAHRDEMARWLGWFEALLDGRDHLLGDGFGVADLCAFPFLKYGVIHPPGDDELFHQVLMENLPIAGRLPRLEAWVRRVDERPRAL
jgi:maleylpyruvate isomerase